jgi:predicted O-linked N-acetylglucosamine transferase (SPINDLY family)
MLSNDPDKLFAEALDAHLNGRIQEAFTKYGQILERHPNHPETLHHLGLIYLQSGDLAQAIPKIKKSLESDPKNSNALSNLGYCFNTLGEFKAAIDCCHKALQVDPSNDGAWTNLGNAQRACKLSDAAQDSYQKALNLQPNNPGYIYNLANTYYNQEDFQRASNLFKQCLAIENRIPEAQNNLSACLIKLKDPATALLHVNASIELKPDYAEAWSNRGVALNDLKRHEEALASYERSIELKPDYAEAWSNRGVALNDLKRHEEALASYNKSIELKPDYAEAWSNRGVALNDLKRHEEALTSYERAIELEPDIDFILGTLVHTQMKICDWTDLEQRRQALERKLLGGSKASDPFAVLGLFDNPKLQKRCAEIYAQEKYSLKGRLGVLAQKPKRDKIRIGYFSMDFKDHPVSHLIAELFELHDRNKFEIYGFSFGVNSQDPMRQRVEKAFDKFLDVKHLSDLGIARLSREHEIDIAIDLGGYTQDSRPQVFAERVAPIQINYLGFPGTWGSDCMDYFIGDKVTIPDQKLECFSERIIFLPNSFQVNPSDRPIASSKPSRQDYGLSNDSFVLCCFNNSWKITPEVFGQWIQILQKAPNSVLWLYADSLSAEKNLRLEAIKRDITVDRVIFAKRVHRDTYLAQFQHADLFLDTLPYNAGTTASDALWAGLPVLTHIGKSFASRMAASLLTNIRVPELITHSKEEYCSLAVELASNPEKLTAIKTKLAQNRLTTPLFNTELSARHIEAAYLAAYDRYQAGLPPDHIDVDP